VEHAGRARAPGPRGRWSIAALALLLIMQPATGQDAPVAEARPGAVTQEILEAKIAEVEAATGIEETARAALVARYRKALSNLQTAGANAQAADDFRLAAQRAPAEVEAIRQQMEEAAAQPPEDGLDLDPSLSLRQVEQLLQKEQADLAAVDARRADVEQRLAEAAGRPALIRQRLAEAKLRQAAIATQLQLPPPADAGPATAEARRWVLQTEADALSTEIKRLDQELLSQAPRIDLLKAKRDQAAAERAPARHPGQAARCAARRSGANRRRSGSVPRRSASAARPRASTPWCCASPSATRPCPRRSPRRPRR
jgi:potassium efflux system protein